MKHLTREQRYGISFTYKKKRVEKIVKTIGVITSTISRKLRKNCDTKMVFTTTTFPKLKM